jgi:diguanylate cyclase (GGDEF)-like protein
MDKFKKINDTHGHHIGDLVLREVANMIRQRIRASDVLSRYGGEEFSAILTQTSLEVAFDIAERIRKDIAAKKFVLGNGKTLSGTISIGLTCMHPIPEHENAEIIGKKLLQQADENLYEAKRTGRNRVVAQRDGSESIVKA